MIIPANLLFGYPRRPKSLAGVVRRARNAGYELGGLCYTGYSTLTRRHENVSPPIIYVGDVKDWAPTTIGRYTRPHLEKYYSFRFPSKSQFTWRGARHSLVHFGSPMAPVFERPYRLPHTSNKLVITWTHRQRSDPDPSAARLLDNAHEVGGFADKIIALCQIGANTMLSEGVPPDKLVTIPLGVDTRLFHPPTQEWRARIREWLNIPETAYCIGSFQKDGVGWGDGLSPKWVKGPDIFLEVIRRLRHEHELCVLLTGPARGYVKKGLDEMGVQYRHVYLKDYREMAKHYWALDLYIVASRDEGGPMALLESMASGVPLVATRVGMCPDIMRDGNNGFLADVEDVDGLVASASRLLTDRELRQEVSQNAFRTAQSYDWCVIAKRYHQEVYRPLMLKLGYEVELGQR